MNSLKNFFDFKNFWIYKKKERNDKERKKYAFFQKNQLKTVSFYLEFLI